MNRKVISILSLFIIILFLYLISQQIINGYNTYKEIKNLNKILTQEINKETYYKKVLELANEYQSYNKELKKYFFSDTILSSFYFNIKADAKKLFNVDITNLVIDEKLNIGKEGEKKFNISMTVESNVPLNIIKFVDFLINETEKHTYPLFFLSSFNLSGTKANLSLYGYIHTNNDKIVLSKEVLTQRYTVCEIYAEILDMKNFGKPINENFLIAEYENKYYLCRIIEKGVDVGRAELLKNQSVLEGKIYLVIKEEGGGAS